MLSAIKIAIVCAGLSMLFVSCKDLIVEPEAVPIVIAYNEYKPIIDSTYFKLWSDSTWEKFSSDTVINGILYHSIIDNTGKLYFYNNSFELSGYKEPEDSLILFNEPLTLPNQLTLNKVYTLQTSFRCQNIICTVVLKQTYTDTTTVSFFSNNFNGCVIVKSSFQVTANGGDDVENEQLWLAKGLNTIKKIKDFRDTAYVVQAVVNGKKWSL